MKTIQKSKQLKMYALAVVATLALSSCTKEEKHEHAENEEEFISTVTATFTPEGGGTAIVLQSKDSDGEGGKEPVNTVSGNFEINKTYKGTLTYKNELVNPAEDITLEIIKENTEHQIFYQTTGAIPAFTYSTDASNFDANKKPLGLQTVFKTAGAATGTVTITLKHEPNKSATNVDKGDITNAGGATDSAVTFTITVGTVKVEAAPIVKG